MVESLYMIDKSLDFHIYWSAHHNCPTHETEWRSLPYLVIHYTADSVYRCSYRKNGTVETIEARKGQAVLVPSGLVHQMKLFKSCETSNVGIKYTIFGGIDPLSLYRPQMLIDFAQASKIKMVLDKLAKVVEFENQLDIAVIARKRALAFELLSELLDNSKKVPEAEKRILALQCLKPALTCIDENLAENISTETLAELCSLSRQRFSILFKESMGCPPYQYILKLRLEKAMSLLAFSCLKVGEIASSLGFFDQPHFTKLFSSVTGLSPMSYRRKMKLEALKRSAEKKEYKN